MVRVTQELGTRKVGAKFEMPFKVSIVNGLVNGLSLKEANLARKYSFLKLFIFIFKARKTTICKIISF